MKKQVFTTAWELLKSKVFKTFGEALKAAWAKAKIQEKLKAGIVYFSFKKANGDTRQAIGTLREGNFQYQDKGQGSYYKPYLVKYWDVEVNQFRSFKIQNLIKVY